MKTRTPELLTPVELVNGRYYKREDLYRNERYGVNGAKYRACQYLVTRAASKGAEVVVSASSVLSPQAAMAAVVAEEIGLPCTVVLGSTRPDTAAKHPSVRIALEAGASLNTESRSAFNSSIQKLGRELAELLGGWLLPYGITTPPSSSREEIEDFLDVGGNQVNNLPGEIRRIVIPFGSGNTAAGVLYGLSKYGAPRDLEEVVLVGVGPDRMEWLEDRLSLVGVPLTRLGFEIRHIPLHGWFANYGDRMREKEDGISFHPTYEGKAVRFLNGAGDLEWWSDRDGTTCFWIVGGEIG